MNRDKTDPPGNATARPTPRILHAADIPGAMSLKNSAGWNQTEQDWKLLQELEPCGGFALEEGGKLASTATVICYGQELAWIGMVLTAQHLRRRGFANQVMSQAIEYALGRGVARIGLDATDMGIELYGRMGFEPRGLVERWARRADAPAIEPLLLDAWRADPVFDAAAFGARRDRLLEALSRWEAASIPGGGHAMGRPGSQAAYFGPCVARTASDARMLLRWFLGLHPGEAVYWDLLASNSKAVLLARDYGFEPVRMLTRMTREVRLAASTAADNSLVFAIAGLEFG